MIYLHVLWFMFSWCNILNWCKWNHNVSRHSVLLFSTTCQFQFFVWSVLDLDIRILSFLSGIVNKSYLQIHKIIDMAIQKERSNVAMSLFHHTVINLTNLKSVELNDNDKYLSNAPFILVGLMSAKGGENRWCWWIGPKLLPKIN